MDTILDEMIRAAVPLNLIENGRISPDPAPWAWQCVSLTNEGKRIECILRRRRRKKSGVGVETCREMETG
jgi:hypothetical protein